MLICIVTSHKALGMWGLHITIRHFCNNVAIWICMFVLICQLVQHIVDLSAYVAFVKEMGAFYTLQNKWKCMIVMQNINTKHFIILCSIVKHYSYHYIWTSQHPITWLEYHQNLYYLVIPWNKINILKRTTKQRRKRIAEKI